MSQRFVRLGVCASLLLSLADCAQEHPESGNAKRPVVTNPASAPREDVVDPRPSANAPREGVVDPQPGGQSGGEGLEPCLRVDQPLSAASEDGVRLQDLWDQLQPLLNDELKLQWWPKVRRRAPAPAMQLIVSNAKLREPALTGCGSFETVLEFDARSADDVLEGHFAGKLTVYVTGENGMQISLELASGRLRDGPASAELRDGAVITAELEWHEWDNTLLYGELRADGEKIANVGTQDDFVWIPSEVQPATVAPVTRSELQTRACGATTAAPLAPFASDQAVFQALGKRWIACSGQTNLDPSFAGIDIDSSGHWRELRQLNGELVTVAGFGHEGEISRNQFGDGFNVAFLDWFPQRYSFFSAGLSADGKTLRLDTQMGDLALVIQATFQVTDLPVRQPTAAFEKGARAGQAGCAAGESDLTTRPASSAAVRELLLGRWMFCSGKLGTEHAGIEIEAGDRYHFLAADGSASTEGGTFVIIDTSSQNGRGAYQVNLTPAAGGGGYLFGLPMFSDTPRKFLANDAYETVLSAM